MIGADSFFASKSTENYTFKYTVSVRETARRTVHNRESSCQFYELFYLTDAHVQPSPRVPGFASNGTAVSGQGLFASSVIRQGSSELINQNAPTSTHAIHNNRMREPLEPGGGGEGRGVVESGSVRLKRGGRKMRGLNLFGTDKKLVTVFI